MADPRILGSNRRAADAPVDVDSGAVPNISLEHATIHDGRGFWMWQEDTDFDIATPILFDILAPASPLVHLRAVDVYHGATSALLEIIEAPTLTPGTTAVPIYNLDRASAKVSGVSVFSDPIGISGGTKLIVMTLLTAGPRAPLVDISTEHEIILKPSARTLISLTSAQDNQVGRVGVFFYIPRE